jgi:hypothetical protein
MRLLPVAWANTADSPPPAQIAEHVRSGMYGCVILPVPAGHYA